MSRAREPRPWPKPVRWLAWLLAVMVVGGIKLYHLSVGTPAILVTQSPYFYLSLVCMILGVQLFLCGFLGELIIRHSADRNEYEISEEIKGE